MVSTKQARSIAVIGGTGALGIAVSWRLARAGHRVIIGSRDAERAEQAADLTRSRCTNADVRGGANATAAMQAEIAFLTVPYAAQLDTLREVSGALAGKLLIDTTVPLVPPKVARVQLPGEGSAALRAQELLGDSVSVVSALHNVAAAHLNEARKIACEVLVFGDKRADRETAAELILDMELKPWHAGSLANSAAAEALTSVLIFINRFYETEGAGIRLAMD